MTTLLDAGAFLRDYARMTAHFEAQARLATVLVINKTDLATPAALRMIESTVRTLNPSARMMQSTYGIAAPVTHEPAPHHDHDHAPQHEGQRGHDHAHDHDHDHDHAHDHAHAHGDHAHDEALGFSSWSDTLTHGCEPALLAELLDDVCAGGYGQVERLKGIARSQGGWIRFDVAGGRGSMAAFAPQHDAAPRGVAIGHALDGVRLKAAFDACAGGRDAACLEAA